MSFSYFGGNVMQQQKDWGKLSGPVVADKVYVRTMDFGTPGVEAKSWVLIRNDRRLHLNTYDGELGQKITDEALQWLPIAGKKRREIERKYTETTVDECPFAISPDDSSLKEESAHHTAVIE